jgi:hypothetical protein
MAKVTRQPSEFAMFEEAARIMSERAFVTLLFVGLLGFLLYLAWKDISIPVGAYPDSIWSKFSSWIDDTFAASPIAGGKIQNSVDSWLAKVWVWINGNLPRSTNAKNWDPNAGSGAGSVSTGSDAGSSSAPDGSVAETSNGSSLDEYQIPEEPTQLLDQPGTPIDPYAGNGPPVQLPQPWQGEG